MEHAVIVDVEATPTRISMEVDATETMIDRTQGRFGLKPERIAGGEGNACPQAEAPVHGINVFPAYWRGNREYANISRRCSALRDGPRNMRAKTAFLVIFAILAVGIIPAWADGEDLPIRSGPRPETTAGVPHMQIGVEARPELSLELLRRVATIPVRLARQPARYH